MRSSKWSIISILLCLFAFRVGTILVKPPVEHSWGINKGTERELKLFLGSDASFDNPMGLATVRLKAWEDTETEADDDEVIVYGVNSGRGEIIYNKSMKSLGAWKGEGEKELHNPRGITADSDGWVYIADTGNRRIVALKNSGKRLHYVKAFGDQRLVAPYDVALDNRGKIYVADSAKSAVMIFDTTGKALKKLPLKGLISPTGIAVTDQYEKWTYVPNNMVVVVDSAFSRISVFNFIGELEGRITGKGIGLDKVAFLFVALDYNNNIYVTDSVNNVVHKFDSRLNYLASFDDELNCPRGIAIYRKFGQSFIAERKAARYYWIGTDILNLRYSITDHKLRVDFLLPEPSLVSVKLDKKKIFQDQRFGSGDNTFYIPLENGEPGKLTMTAEATYSSRNKFKRKLEEKIEP